MKRSWLSRIRVWLTARRVRALADRSEGDASVLSYQTAALDDIRDRLGASVREVISVGSQGRWEEALGSVEIVASHQLTLGHPVSEVEESILAAMAFAIEMNGGGFSQYFLNSSGDDWPALRRFLQGIDNPPARELLGAAIAVFPNSNPSIDQSTRFDELEAAYPDDYYAPFERLDQQHIDNFFPTLEERWRYVVDNAELIPDRLI